MNMRAIRSTRTIPEMAVRSAIHGLGYRYRLHIKGLPGKPDIVFGPKKKIVFVHGCFWHQHPDKTCPDSRLPKSRLDYWVPKLARNIERDAENIRALREGGWKVLIVWECQTRKIAPLQKRLVKFLE